ncbi:ADP-ribosylation factor-like protein 6-interacting protein 1 [Glandiceps talaboti]
MAAEMDNVPENQQKDEEIERLEKSLHSWRYVLVQADKVLTWEKKPYPYILAAGVTIKFLIICLLQPSILTSIALTIMALCLVDYLVPAVSSKYLQTNEWTPDQERQFQHVCIELVNDKRCIQDVVNSAKKLRQEKPKHYFMVVMSVLSVVAFIGNAIPNLLLMYFLVLFLVLLPGLKHHGILAKYYALVLEKINKLIKRKKKEE